MTLLGPAKCQLSWDCNNGIGKWYFICTQGCKHLCTHTWKDTMNRNQSTQTCTLCSPGVPNEQVITLCTCAHTYEGMSSSPLSQQRDVNQPTESQIYDSRSGWSPLSSNWLIHVFQTAHMSYIIPTGHTMSGHKVPSWGWNRWSWLLLWHFCDCLELCSSLFMQNSLAVWVFTEIILAQLSFPCVKRLLCYCQVTQLIICTKEKLYSTQVWLWLVKHWFATPHILGSAQLRCFMYAVISIKNMTLYYAITFQAVKTWKSTWGESVQVIFRSHITTSPL